MLDARANLVTAEISKVTENAYRDVNIAFANEVALICESLGANVHETENTRVGAGYDY
jgi:UDP-N-acetyl-D-mannosaminuronate dehydrogenase